MIDALEKKVCFLVVQRQQQLWIEILLVSLSIETYFNIIRYYHRRPADFKQKA